MLTVGKAETATKKNLKVGKLIFYTFMKKILILATSVVIISCQNNVPKCDEPEVFETIYSILRENKDEMKNEYGFSPLFGIKDEEINAKSIQISDILTTKNDNELKSCSCEGTITIMNNDSLVGKGIIEYSAQKNSDDNIVVKLENLPLIKN